MPFVPTTYKKPEENVSGPKSVINTVASAAPATLGVGLGIGGGMIGGAGGSALGTGAGTALGTVIKRATQNVAGIPTGKTPGELAFEPVTEGSKAAAIDLATYGVGKILSPVAKVATKTLPKYLMEGVFKESKRQAESKIREAAGERIGEGVLKSIGVGTGKDIPSSLGEEALKRGETGSAEEILDRSLVAAGDLDSELDSIFASSKKKFNISEIQGDVGEYIKKLRSLGNTADADAVEQRLSDLSKVHKKDISLKDANEIKRGLYREVQKSYGSKSSEAIEGIKIIAKSIKEKIENKVGGDAVSNINKELSYQERVINSMVSKLAGGKMGLADIATVLTGTGLAPTTSGASLALPAAMGVVKYAPAATRVSKFLGKTVPEVSKKVSPAVNIISKIAGQGARESMNQ